MLKLYNTLTRKKEIFRPRKNKKADFFVCGPTVYDFSHIGHARTYIAFDVISKYLREKGYDVFYLQNITDVDDKIIKRAKERKMTWKKLARFFEKEYLQDMKDLKVNGVTKYARATDYIKEIISQVNRLLKRGYAYRTEDGIYYDISKFKNYGKLSKRTALMAQDAVSRIDESKKKRNKGDFCLWKFSKPEEPRWKSPWGWGRPGWHIEDTAITEKHFGPQYDAHGGARDLIFPHHEAEIAQMEAISGKKPMVKYWLHTGFLTVNGQKMSKSLGNFITIKDFLKNHSPRILRFFVLKSHYRSPINYSEKVISQIKEESKRIAEFIGRLKGIASSNKRNSGMPGDLILKAKRKFEKMMDDDFNTPKAIAAIFEFINKTNYLIDQNKINKDNANDILNLFGWFDKILGIDLTKAHYSIILTGVINIKDKVKIKKIPKTILKLAQKRKKYRQEKNWQKADEIRKEIEKSGYLFEDTKKGTKIKKKS